MATRPNRTVRYGRAAAVPVRLRLVVQVRQCLHCLAFHDCGSRGRKPPRYAIFSETGSSLPPRQSADKRGIGGGKEKGRHCFGQRRPGQRYFTATQFGVKGSCPKKSKAEGRGLPGAAIHRAASTDQPINLISRTLFAFSLS